MLAVLFPESCCVCDADLASQTSRARPASRLESGKLRRPLVGALQVPLRLLCRACASRLRPAIGCAAPRGGVLHLSAFQPGPEIFEILHRFKYGGVPELAPWLGAWMARRVRRTLRPRPLLLVPVPLHAERLRERGFNQSRLLAEEVGRRIGCAVVEDLLVRRVATPPLAQLEHAERRARVQGAFARKRAIPRRHALLVLVDDVVTTGATSAAALAALDVADSLPCVVLSVCHASMESHYRPTRVL
ncbi:MAG: ComF family protein [Candidatus Latescibacterota bacterium]|nr:MAG: ComF family protein [Candidatus Latescibacterota bacterium]